jgi:Dolichyl-phosphate-mannose-protein mannosyltransferase
LAAIFFAAGVCLYTRHNGFPCYYHPEEPGKARQLLTERFNFHHPLLLLQATWLTSWITRSPQMPQPVVETGRTVSAIFAAGAVACFSLLAAHLYGSAAAACVGALLLANSQLYELAHYMKEDAAFAFGIAAFFLALTRCWLRPSMTRFAVLGAAAALAVSAKYIGALVVPFAFVPAFQLREKACHRVLILSAALFAVLLVINFPIFASLDSFLGGLGREVDFVLHGHKGLTRSVPHDFYVGVFLGARNPVIWILLGLYYVRLFTFSRRIHPAEWMLTLFPILYVLILSFSPKTANHYFLPDTLIFCVLAAFGLFCFTLGGSARITFGAQAAGFLAAFGISVAHLIPYDFAFNVDSRQQLLAFVRQNVPPTATIAQDKSVNLPNRSDPRHASAPYFLEQTIVGHFFAADVGSIDELRARGIRYIAVAEKDYGWFFRRTHRPTKSILADYNRRKNFYERLFREGELLWECKAGLLPILQPHIRLYYLPSEPSSGKAQGGGLEQQDVARKRICGRDWPHSDSLVKIMEICCSKDVVGARRDELGRWSCWVFCTQSSRVS